MMIMMMLICNISVADICPNDNFSLRHTYQSCDWSSLRIAFACENVFEEMPYKVVEILNN